MTNHCNCCEGIQKLTPRTIENRSGLDSLSYRIGTHGSFFETMLSELSNAEMPGGDETKISPLIKLTTRDGSDMSIAILDAWATVADVLTFYQERIANEGYLRTAKEWLSLTALAGLVGYRPRPGVSASVYLAYLLDNVPPVTIPAGTRSQSLPKPGETPQFYETSEDLTARYEWNTFSPRSTRPTNINSVNAEYIDTLYFQGISTNLKPNDPLLFEFSSGPVVRWVESVKPDPATNRTKVCLRLQSNGNDISAIRGVADRFLNAVPCSLPKNDVVLKALSSALNGLEQEISPDRDQEDLVLLSSALAYPSSDLRVKAWKGWISSILKPYLHEVQTSPEEELFSRAIVELSPLAGFLTQALPQLNKPASVQPASLRQLQRPLSGIFSVNADIGLRMIAEMSPRPLGVIYSALAGAESIKPSELQSVSALRVTTGPFGRNVPRQVKLGTHGKQNT